jgi:predicted Zn-dependent protease
MIRNGAVAEPVRDVTLSGNVFRTLADIEAIGDDFYWDESGAVAKGARAVCRWAAAALAYASAMCGGRRGGGASAAAAPRAISRC